jgi:transcription antitermination factor NusG
VVDERTPIGSYLFVQATISPPQATTLERSRFTRSVVRLPGVREAARITDDELGRMVVESPRPVLRTNQRVTVMTGDFAGLEGRVVGVNARMVRVEITLHSVVREIYISKAEVQQCGTTGTISPTLT